MSTKEENKALLAKDASTSQTPPAKTSKAVAVLQYVSLILLLCSSINTIYQSGGDRGTVMFVVNSCAILFLLFVNVQWFQDAPPTSSTVPTIRQRLVIWSLAMVLNCMFSHGVADYSISEEAFQLFFLILFNALLMMLMWDVGHLHVPPNEEGWRNHPIHARVHVMLSLLIMSAAFYLAMSVFV